MSSLVPWVIASIVALICLVLVWVAMRYAVRVMPSRRSERPPLNIVASQAIGTRERLVVVRYQSKDYVLGVTPNRIELIDTQAANKQSNDAAALHSHSSE